ncbi:VTC domain-containing protein [Streptomyces sp. V4I8]|uniref:VTC domain-containing protein n=1 Tax=Streptomyces sp. V4I8 TaxID=3156469 RepID=UPI0035150FF0
MTTRRKSPSQEEDRGLAEEQPLHVASRLHAFNRFELKYLVPVEQAAEIRDELAERMDRDLNSPVGGYGVRSLYYDTPQLRFYWEKIEGLKFRRKLRIRHYGNPDGVTDESPVCVEIKQRVNRVTQKRRITLPYGVARQLCDGREMIEHSAKEGAFIQEVLELVVRLNLQPTAITGYQREALVGRDADTGLRFKAAVKELARREGRLATFMAKPFNDAGGSGFHLHLSCEDAEGRNAFDDPAGAYGLSAEARHAAAGILAHAPALAALANPTVNSCKRFGPDTLAPWLIDWGLDNRSAMVRIPPERGSGARLELRLGDASANPYLLIAGTLAAALLGIEAGEEPPAPLEGYGYDTGKSAVLPMSLSAALDALEADTALTGLLGKAFTTSFLTCKRDEVERFGRHVTDWEFTEYAHHL